PDAQDLRDQILEKVLLVRQLRTFGSPNSRRATSASVPVDRPSSRESSSMRAVPPYIAPKHVVAIASSTGGPSALLEIFGKVTRTGHFGIVVAQHMPAKFTRTFADRLDRKGVVRTSEAQDGDRIGRLTGFVCPG